MSSLWNEYQTTIELGLIHGLFGVALFASFWTGVLNLAPVAIGALTGFGYAALARDHNTSLGVAIIIAIFVGTLAGWVIGAALLRVSSHFLAMATIALLLVSSVVILNLKSVTGGAVGVSVPGGASLGVNLAAVVVVGWIMSRLRKSRFGYAVDAVREDAAVAASLGIDVRHVRLVLFAASGAISGVAGVLMASRLQYIGNQSYSVSLAFTVLAALVLGGAYHWAGALVGAVIFQLLPEVLAKFFADDTGRMVNGVILIVIMIYLPRGFVDPARWQFTWSRRKPSTVEKKTAGLGDGERGGQQ